MEATDKYKFMPESAIKNQARHLATKCTNDAVHKINKYLIFKFRAWEVINTEKLTIQVFNTEQEAIDYCLDRYKESKIPIQIELL